MAQVKLATKHLVAIIWDDAHGQSLGDFSESEVARDFHKAATYTSFGLLIQQDDAGVTIASEHEGVTYRGLSFIPARMVVEIIDLGIPARKRVMPKKSRREPVVLPEGVETP